MSPFVKYSLFVVLGIAIGVGATAAVVKFTIIPKFNAALDEDQKTIERYKEGAKSMEDALGTSMSTVTRLMGTIKRLNVDLAVSQGMVLNANRGADRVVAFPEEEWTVLFEPSNGTTVNLSILPGMPKISLTPNSSLTAKWIIPTVIMPKVIGDPSNTMFYWYQPKVSTWRGPYAPLRQ